MLHRPFSFTRFRALSRLPLRSTPLANPHSTRRHLCARFSSAVSTPQTQAPLDESKRDVDYQRIDQLPDRNHNYKWTVDRESTKLAMAPHGDDVDVDSHEVHEEYRVRNVLIVCKIRNAESARAVSRVAQLLVEKYDVRVVLEEHVLEDMSAMEFVAPGRIHPSLFYFKLCDQDIEKVWTKIDLAITVGGDGTMLYLHSLFGDAQHPIPPVLPFGIGNSLGFLLPHNLNEYEESIRKAMEGDALATERMRLECEIWRQGSIVKKRDAMNEFYIHRGLAQMSCIIKSYINGVYCTTSRGDGIIISTPTGSTGYNLSCGGPMVHPISQSIIMTPICPNVPLSFRPTVLPSVAEVKLEITEKSRTPGVAYFDSRLEFDLEIGDVVLLRKSQRPIITIDHVNSVVDWMNSVNRRIRQQL